jgi:hypothetical protein
LEINKDIIWLPNLDNLIALLNTLYPIFSYMSSSPKTDFDKPPFLSLKKSILKGWDETVKVDNALEFDAPKFYDFSNSLPNNVDEEWFEQIHSGHESLILQKNYTGKSSNTIALNNKDGKFSNITMRTAEAGKIGTESVLKLLNVYSRI